MKKLLPLILVTALFAVKGFSNTQIVTVQNFSFSPSSFTINLGDTIKFVWVNGSHTTTSLTVPAGAATWDSPLNSTSTSFTYVPTKTGAYTFKCIPHFTMNMKGDFTVNCPQATSHISASGATVFCKGGSVLLKSSVSAGITAYQWKKNGTNISGANSPNFTATTTGSYTLSVTNSCTQTAVSNAIAVTVNPLPNAVITPGDTVFICHGSTVILKANTGTSLAYVWKKNGTTIPGATSSTYTATTAGSYRVIVTKTTTGCSQGSNITRVIQNCSPAMAAKLPGNDLKIYPNPSSNDFHISLPELSDKYSLSVFDADGKLIGNKQITSKDFSFGNDLKSGIYFVEVKNGNNIIAREKIIKE